MKLSLMAAVAENGVIGSGPDIPWQVKGEQLLFKALTFNQWLIVGRKTFDSMGCLPNRRYVVVSRSARESDNEHVRYVTDTDAAIAFLAGVTDHAIVAGGGEIYRQLLPKVQTLHLSVIHAQLDGDIVFPPLPAQFQKVFEQAFSSNIDYTYQIWQAQQGQSGIQ